MRTLERKLSVPEPAEHLTDETAWAILLPRRRTRWLYRILAVVVGVAAGLAYAHFIADDPGVLWSVALGAVGAILGYVIVLMPAVIVHGTRRLMTSLAVRRRASAFRAAIERVSRSAQRQLDDDSGDGCAWERVGAAALLRGEEETAASAFQHAYAASDDGRGSINLAVALAESRDLETAADLMLKTPDDSDTAPVAHHNLGVLLSKDPRPDLVNRILRSLNKLHSPSIVANLGAWELARGDLDLAERYLARAVDEDPSAMAPRANLALVAFRRGDVKGAVTQMSEASYLDPMNPTVAIDLGAMLTAAGQPMPAARALSRAALLAPASPAVQLNRGCIHLAVGQYDDALEVFNDPIVRERYPIVASHNTALALIALDRIEPAKEELERGLERAPDDGPLLNNLGCIAWAEGDDAKMVQVLSSLEEAEDAGVTLNLSSATIAAGKTEEALEMLQHLRSKGNRDPLVSFYRGLALLAEAVKLHKREMTRPQRERFFEALHKCVKPFNAVASSDVAGSFEAKMNLALYRYLRLEFAEAADGFLEAAKAYPENGFVHFCAGTALAEEARRVQMEHEENELVGRARDLLKRARKHLETAVECDEVTADAFCNLGMCAYDLGDTEGALNAFKRMTQLEDSADSNNNMAIVHARQGQKLQHSARAAGLASRDREREMLNRAQTHLSTALHYFMQALEHNREDAILHGNIGLAFMLRNRGNDVEAALRYWQRMLALGGEHAGKRYQELTEMAHGKGEARAQFDEALMEFRSLDPHRCMVSMPPRLSGPRYALQPITDEMDWEIVSDDPTVRDLLRRRDRLAGLRKRLARLSV